MKYKVSIYPESVKGIKKDDINKKKVCKFIAEYPKEVSLEEFSIYIENLHIWCPATFKGERKAQNELSSIQLFALDFDGGISISEVLERAEKYRIPASMYYETMNSVNFSKFRVVFICNIIVTDVKLALLIINCICTIFPEVDHTSKDFSKLYYPGYNIHYRNDTFFNIYDLLLSTMQYLEKNDYKNKARIIKSISKKTGIILKNNSFYIEFNSVINNSGVFSPPPLSVEGEEELRKKQENEDIQPITIYNNMVNDHKSSAFSYNIYFSNSKRNIITEQNNGKNYNIKIDSSNCERCKLLYDFVNGRRLPHSEWFGLMLNLIHIKGGKKLFAETIEKYADIYNDTSRKLEQMSWSAKNCHYAQNCDNYCPYSDKCVHGSNMCYTLKNAGKEIYKVDDEIVYEDINTMRDNLKKTLEKNLKTGGINVIKAPTGSGKTFSYLNAVKHSDKQTVVAVPNVKLMRAIANEACNMGIDFIQTPVIEDCLDKMDSETASWIRFLYQIGDDTQINYILRDSGNDTAQEYLSRIDNIRKFKGTLVITTHARLLNMKQDYLESRNVIIDEDILPQMIQIKKVSVKEISQLLNKLKCGIPVQSCIYAKLTEIISTDGYSFIEPLKNLVDTGEKAVINSYMNQKCESNIYYALYSRCFYRKSDDDNVYFLYARSFPCCDCNILSATADETIYRRVFNERLNRFDDLGHLKNMGQLILHHDMTYSRDCLNRNPQVLYDIREKHKDCDIITFKEYAETGEVYLGASHGFNHLQGHNLAVIGTFHRPEYVYKLWGMFLENKISGDVMANRRIKRNGFSFQLMTYSDSLLQIIQLWMIESESEQAVGRARLVSYKCTVHLYSNFPLRGAEGFEEKG